MHAKKRLLRTISPKQEKKETRLINIKHIQINKWTDVSNILVSVSHVNDLNTESWVVN